MKKIFLIFCLLVVLVGLIGCAESQTRVVLFGERMNTAPHGEQGSGSADSVIGLGVETRF